MACLQLHNHSLTVSGPETRSIFEKALGAEEFARLHPKMQERHGANSCCGIASIGSGVMDCVWHGPWFTVPFLACGAIRRILFPEQGRNVPTSIANHCYRDRYGRDVVSWARTFEFGNRSRRFDEYMIYSEKRGLIVYAGTHQHMAVDVLLSVTDCGGLRFQSHDQRFYEGILGFRFPRAFSGDVVATEWFDESIGKFRIEVEVVNCIWGQVFGYRGTFDVRYEPFSEVPPDVLPRREEWRE